MNAATKPSKDGALNVHQRLSLARQLFHAEKLSKSGRNTFANYSYFELGDFLVPALKIFDQVGLCAEPISFSAELATMTIVNIDNPQDRVSFTSPMGSAALKGCHEVQNIGAVETYQRRYLWSAAVELVEHDALDASAGAVTGQSRGDAESPGGPILVSEADVAKIIGLCEAVGGNQAQLVCEAYKVSAITELTPKQAEAAVKRLEQKLAEKAKEDA